VSDKDFPSGHDPRRSLALLWGRQEAGRRGPKQRLSTEAVVQAAIALADAEGLAALSMRRVAETIGVSPMSLYTYVPSKAELVDLMFDRTLGATADPDDGVAGWRAKLAFIARQRWALVERHPWFLDLPLHRPPLGPNVLRKAEVLMAALDGAGLAGQDISLVAEALQNYVTGAQQSARDARDAESRSGITDEQWIELIRPMLEEHFDAETYPALARLGEAARRKAPVSHSERTARFEFGLERVLDGLEAYIRERHP
jgi:AcrR family transcriptional regulator